MTMFDRQLIQQLSTIVEIQNKQTQKNKPFNKKSETIK